MTPSLCDEDAFTVVERLRRREVSPAEAIEACVRRIEETNAQVNSITTVCAERAMDAARALGDRPVTERGWLAGLPVAIKELTDVAGVRTTYGSEIFTDHVPTRSDHMVNAVERHGGIVLAKTNVPEFGAGAQTFNSVFGTTKNPWDLSRTCGGSSGGSAVALACGQAWLATGTDMGGSLRNPASFCGITGLRPTPGRVPKGSGGAQVDLPFDPLYVNGPMARNVRDLALFLDSMAGRMLHDPISVDPPSTPFVDVACRARNSDLAGLRIGFSENLDLVPVSRDVRQACRAATERLRGVAATVEDAAPDFTGVVDTFMPLRSYWFAAVHEPTLERFRDRLKPEIVTNIEAGLKITAHEIGVADRARAHLYARMADFFGDHDLLALPTVVTTAFSHEKRYLEEIEGVKFDNYVGWLVLTFALTVTSCPCISVPVGFSADGLPIGLQLVAPPFCEARLIRAAAVLERELGLQVQLPISPRG